MRGWRWRVGAAAIAVTGALWAARADYSIPVPSSGATATVFAFVCQTTKICPSHVLIDSTGTEKATASNPLLVGPPVYTPSAPTTSNAGKLATGATAQNLFAAAEVVHGCVITNPLSAADQNIATAEEIWVSFVSAATQAANSPSIPLQPGQSIGCPGGSTLAVSWIATTINHQISAYKF